jgi:hypothetical protein
MVPVVSAISSAQLPWLLCGALGGYLLVMFTSPVRVSLRDGARCIRRYPAMWVTLGVFGFAYGLFQLTLRVYFSCVLPFEDRPAFVWMRAAWRDPNLWLHGSPESVWFLPPHAVHDAIGESVVPAVESVAGVFNCVFSTFPVAAVAAFLLLVNWQGHHAVMWRALRKRFGFFGWLVHLGILVCAFAALAKPLIYAAPQIMQARGASPAALTAWFQWSPLLVWIAFIFEYLFGVCMQIYLILLAYAWVRGLSFTHSHLLDFAIRRCSAVLKWALIVTLLSSVFIDLPLILKNFDAFRGWFTDDAVLVDGRQYFARAMLSAFLLCCASVQITLVFHSESWRKALRDHVRFLDRHWWPFIWFVVIAALHLYLFQVGAGLVLRGLGEETAAGIVWMLVSPWLRAMIAGWLLASWVCFFRRCDTGHDAVEELIQY